MGVRRQVRFEPNRRLVVGPLVLEPSSLLAVLGGKPLELSKREFGILQALARRSHQVVSRLVLWESVWEAHCEPTSNVIDVYIGYLRRKFGTHARMLKTVRGAGYLLEPVG